LRHGNINIVSFILNAIFERSFYVPRTAPARKWVAPSIDTCAFLVGCPPLQGDIAQAP